jgi:hypothetical protein
MAVVQSSADRAQAGVDVFSHGVHILDATTLVGNSTTGLIDQNGTSKTSSTDEGSLLAADRYIVVHLNLDVLISCRVREGGPRRTMVMRTG